MATDLNQEKNKQHYEELYANYPVKNILYWINHLDTFLTGAIATETSWNALYKGDFKDRLKGKKVLEMGCGDCTNAAVMAALGAEVYANDIASASGRIIQELNSKFAFKYPIKFIEGDFLENELAAAQFDFVIGKAFLHHLTLPIEQQFLKETARLLKPEGEARFFEPAVNNKVLDEIRWHIPVGKRPSKFNKEAFEKWKENDPHPDRSFSSRHFKKAGEEFFKEVKIIPVGSIERFSRFYKWGKKQGDFKRWALEKEKFLPAFFNLSFARGQLIVYTKPVEDAIK